MYRRDPNERAGEVCGLTNEEFSALMLQYQRLVYTVCLQFVHDPHIAEDLTQDTFLSAFSSSDRCDPASRNQWLVRVATNKCKDHLKSAWVRKVGPLYTEEENALPQPRGEPPGQPVGQRPPPDPAADLEARAGEQELRDLIVNLRQPYGPVARLYLLEQKSVAAIAVALGRPQATVQNQLFRAKAILRQQINERRQM